MEFLKFSHICRAYFRWKPCETPATPEVTNTNKQDAVVFRDSEGHGWQDGSKEFQKYIQQGKIKILYPCDEPVEEVVHAKTGADETNENNGAQGKTETEANGLSSTKLKSEKRSLSDVTSESPALRFVEQADLNTKPGLSTMDGVDDAPGKSPAAKIVDEYASAVDENESTGIETDARNPATGVVDKHSMGEQSNMNL